jgi:hypothetical protein
MGKDQEEIMVERILPFFQRGEKALGWAGQPKAWPDDRVLSRLSSPAKDALTLADAKTGVSLRVLWKRQ